MNFIVGDPPPTIGALRILFIGTVETIPLATYFHLGVVSTIAGVFAGVNAQINGGVVV
jgi:hypothetical protein